MSKVKLTADLIEAFAGTLLSPRYDESKPTPPMHREAWKLYCSPHPQVMWIAPRDHAKSTAGTFVYSLAELLFRTSDYMILIGSTEEKSAEQLSNISEELHTNDDLRAEFGVRDFEVDTRTEIIVRMDDGHRFRVLARGAEQRIRGALWNGKRPNLIVCDDMEDDEQVESKDRRNKFRRWFFRAAKQALSKRGKIRVHGTILHEDSLLSRLRKMSSWKHLFYKAHRGFDDFSELLWPERWTEAALRLRRQEFIDANDAPGYSQEFLNDPLDNSDAYLRRDDFLPMSERDHEAHKVIGVGVDFAVSMADSADNTSFTVGGKCVDNLLHIVDERKGKWNIVRTLEEMFSIDQRWHPDFFWVEGGTIWKSLEALIYSEMQKRDRWLNIIAINPTKDKAARGRALQKRHRGGGMRFDKEASWYADYEFELLRFTENAKARQDDQFDSTALLCVGFEKMPEVEEDDFLTDDEVDFRFQQREVEQEPGRSPQTGY